MEIFFCNLPIDWIKVSEILFSSLLTALISAGTIWITYNLGKRQAENNWKREIKRRESEKEISVLEELRQFKEPCIKKFTKTIDPSYNHYFNVDEASLIKITLNKAQDLFQGPEDEKIRKALKELFEITEWKINEHKIVTEHNMAAERVSMITGIFETFESKLSELRRKIHRETKA